MSRHYIHSSLLLSSLAAAALISSCGANGASMDSADQDLIAPPARSDAPQVAALDGHVVAPQPLLPDEGKGVSDWFDLPDIHIPDLGPVFDFDAWWESQHIDVVSGENAIPLDSPIMYSDNVTAVPMITGWHDVGLGILVPEIGTGLDMLSAPGEMSYAMFGLKGIPDGEDVVNVQLQGQLAPGAGDTHGVYIGIGNYDENSFRWYGPYDLASGEKELSFYNIDTTNSSGHAYVTLAVWGGDELELSNLDITIDTMIHFEIPDFEIPELPAWGF